MIADSVVLPRARAKPEQDVLASGPSVSHDGPLVQLPAELLTIVYTFLPARCKLAALSQINHRFPVPTASAFQHDHLEPLGAGLLWLAKSYPRGVALLTQLQSFTFIRDYNSLRREYAALIPQVCRSFAPSLAIAHPFACLRILCLSLPSDRSPAQTSESLLTLFACNALDLPMLHSLYVAATTVVATTAGVNGAYVTVVRLGLWLAGLPSLRHVALAVAGVDMTTLADLMLLPLRSLDLADCVSATSLDASTLSLAAEQAVSGTLRRLWLPGARRSINGRPTTALGMLLQRYADETYTHSTERSVGTNSVEEEKRPASPLKEAACSHKWRLEHLQYPSDTNAELLRFATALPTLTSLHITRFVEPQHLAKFFSNALPFRLPRLSRLRVPVMDLQSRRADDLAVHGACLAFFPSFASQLRHLSLVNLPPSARSCQQLFAHVLTCTELVSLQLIGDTAVKLPITLPARIAPMSQLKLLYIRAFTHRSGRASHLQYADTARLLRSCPLLHDLSLSLPNASVSLLAVLALSCPQLRTVCIRSDDEALWDVREELAAIAAQPPLGVFGSLHTLHIDYNMKAGQESPQPTAALMAALSSLLHRAPILRLCLLPHVDVTNLPFYAAFPRLVRLRLHDPQLRSVLHHYCHAPDLPTRPSHNTADQRLDAWLAHSRRHTQQLQRGGAEAAPEWTEGEEKEDEGWGWEREEEWQRWPVFVGERRFVGEDGRALNGREAWLERGLVVAAAETERRRVVALEKARIAAEEEAEQRKRDAKSGGRGKAKAAPLSATDAFFAETGIKRKRGQKKD